MPDLLDTANGTLNHAGFRPHLDAGDGYGGWPSAAPFDRIIATCAVDHIPPAWIEQLAPRGRVVAPLLGDECALMVLDKTSDDEVTGRFDPYRVSFMPLRDQPDNPLGRGRVLGGAGSGIGQYGTTDLDPATFEQADSDLVLLLHLHLPGLVLGSAEGPDGTRLALSTPDASALVAGAAVDNRWGTIHHGRRLWDTAEYVARLWQLLGQPDRTRYGISALNDATRQYVWLDHPDSRYSWQLPL